MLTTTSAVFFKELTPPFDFVPTDLADQGFLASKSFQLLATPQMAERYVREVLSLRQAANILDRPLLVWEPEPRECSPTALPSILEITRLFDVVSPNHHELLRLYGEPAELDHVQEQVERLAKKFLQTEIGPNGEGALIVRAAEHGCLIARPRQGFRWLPPVFRPVIGEGGPNRFHQNVVDPREAGNAFLGAFTVQLARASDIVEAAVCGTVAASFVVQQISFPRLQKNVGEAVAMTRELWNEEDVRARLQCYRVEISTF